MKKYWVVERETGKSVEVKGYDTYKLADNAAWLLAIMYDVPDDFFTVVCK